jgi:hypothetical protein
MPATSLYREKCMPKFNVHQRRIVRIKVAGVEASDHRDAVSKLSTDEYLRAIEMAVNMDIDEGTVRSIQIDDEEPPKSYIVDVCGDDQYKDTLHYDVREGPEGEVVVLWTSRPHGPPSRILNTALSAAGVQVPRSILGAEEMAKGDPVTAVILSETDGLSSDEGGIALSRLDTAIERLTRARDAIAAMDATRRDDSDAR